MFQRKEIQVRESSDNHPIIIRYFPGIIRFTQVNWRSSSTALKANRPKIGRRFGSIQRSGYQDRGIESSDNHQMIDGNRKINWLVDRSRSPRNHQLIVNRFPVIINSAALNVSPIHHQNRGIYHLARSQPGVRFLELSDNHPTAPGTHPTASRNLPTIDRRNPRIDRFPAGRRVRNLS